MIFYGPEATKKRRNWRRFISIFLALAISALAIYLSFRHIDLDQVRRAIGGVNYFWILLATGNSLFTVYALGWRWQKLLNPRASLSLSALFRLNILSQYANIVAPARMGELLRMYLTSREAKTEAGFVLGTIAAERILDAVVFVAGWFMVSSYLVLENEIPLPVSILIATGAITLLAGFLIFQPDLFMTVIKKGIFFLPQKWQKTLIDFIRNGLEAFSYFKNLMGTIVLLFLTLFLLLSQALTNYLVFLAFGLKLSFWAAVVTILAIQAGSVPPAAPGKIGVFEYAVILALSLFSVPREQALSYAITLHLVAYLPKIILGGFYAARLSERPLQRNRN